MLSLLIPRKTHRPSELRLIDGPVVRVIAIMMMLFMVVAHAEQQQTSKPNAPAAPVGRKPATNASSGLTNTDVVKMVAAGLSEQIVIAAIRDANKRNFDMSPDALIALKQAGVTEPIIATMLGGQAGAPSARVGQPVPVAIVSQIVIPDGTEVRLRLLEALSSATARVDERVRFEVSDDVVVNGTIVIAQGAQAWGTVIVGQKKKSFGRRGKLDFSIDYVKAIHDQNIRVRATKQRQGDESYVKAGVITYLAGPFGMLVKGKDVELAAGSEYAIFIDGDRRINLVPTS
jgi:hypothetical protein